MGVCSGQRHNWPPSVTSRADRLAYAASRWVLSVVDSFEIQPAEDLRANGKSLEEVERQHILSTLDETGWRIDGPNGAAKILGLNPSTLRTRMVKLGIQKQGKSVVKT